DAWILAVFVVKNDRNAGTFFTDCLNEFDPHAIGSASALWFEYITTLRRGGYEWQLRGACLKETDIRDLVEKLNKAPHFLNARVGQVVRVGPNGNFVFNLQFTYLGTNQKKIVLTTQQEQQLRATEVTLRGTTDRLNELKKNAATTPERIAA